MDAVAAMRERMLCRRAHAAAAGGRRADAAAAASAPPQAPRRLPRLPGNDALAGNDGGG